MKRIFSIILAVCTLAGLSSCSNKMEQGTDISGEWKLVDTGGLTDASDVVLEVYVRFDGSNFELYQKLGEQQGRFWLYNGTYNVSGSNILTGRYSDGTLLGGSRGDGYEVYMEGNSLFLTSVFSGEVSEYVKETIPEEVKSEAVPPVRSDEAPSPVL